MAEGSVTQALLVPELLRMIFARVEHIQDLARCVRVNKLWHECSVPYLWKGEVTGSCQFEEYTMLSALAALRNADRFKHYANHLRYLTCKFCIPEHKAGKVSEAMKLYEELLSPQRKCHWKSTQLRYLRLVKNQPYRSEEWPEPTVYIELPIPMLQPKLRELHILGFTLSHELLMACEDLSLRDLRLSFYEGDADIELLSQLIHSQQGLLALSLQFRDMTEMDHGILISRIAELRQLRHLELRLDRYPADVRDFPEDHKLENLQSLHLDFAATIFLSSFMQRQHVPPLRRIQLRGRDLGMSYATGLMKLEENFVQLSRIHTLEEVILHDRICDVSEDIDRALRDFATACPRLRTLQIGHGTSMSNQPVSEELLLQIARSCPRLTTFTCDLEVTSTSATSLIQNILAILPRLIVLDIAVYCNLSCLVQLRDFDPKPQLERLGFGEVHFRPENEASGEDSDHDASTELLDVLKTRFPYLKHIDSRYFLDDLARSSAISWNQYFEMNRPAIKGLGSEVLDQLSRDIGHE